MRCLRESGWTRALAGPQRHIQGPGPHRDRKPAAHLTECGWTRALAGPQRHFQGPGPHRDRKPAAHLTESRGAGPSGRSHPYAWPGHKQRGQAKQVASRP
jgi:hypothetical protein